MIGTSFPGLRRRNEVAGSRYRMSINSFGHLLPPDDLGRKPWAGDRLRCRRLPAWADAR